MAPFKIRNHLVGDESSVFLIAEVGLAHEGSLGQAHAYIECAAETGFDAVKFQTHIATAESTASEKFRVPVFPQDKSRYAYWKRTGFSKQQWHELAHHANDLGIIFLSSPFSNEAVDLLMDCDIAAWKIASGEVSNVPMLRRMVETKLPILVSSGLSSWNELDQTVQLLSQELSPFALFQCTSSYPCPPERWGLNIISEMILRYNCPVGLSDHSGLPAPSYAAVALGATLIEIHVAYSKKQFGPDSAASLTFDEARDMIGGIRKLSMARQNPVDKDEHAKNLQETRSLFTKSIVSKGALRMGHCLREDDLAFKKPGTGISASRIDELVGRRLRYDLPRDHFFSQADFEP